MTKSEDKILAYIESQDYSGIISNIRKDLENSSAEDLRKKYSSTKDIQDDLEKGILNKEENKYIKSKKSSKGFDNFERIFKKKYDFDAEAKNIKEDIPGLIDNQIDRATTLQEVESINVQGVKGLTKIKAQKLRSIESMQRADVRDRIMTQNPELSAREAEALVTEEIGESKYM